MPDLAQTVYDEDTGKLYQKITQEELAQINAFTQQLLAKRKSPSKRNCALCGDYLAGGGTCQRCEKLSAGCPLCGDGSIKEVCLACIKAGAPHCDLCFRALGEGEGRPCKECKAAKNGLPTPDKFPVNDAPVGGIPDGARVYEPASRGATMPAPSFDIPR